MEAAALGCPLEKTNVILEVIFSVCLHLSLQVDAHASVFPHRLIDGWIDR